MAQYFFSSKTNSPNIALLKFDLNTMYLISYFFMCNGEGMYTLYSIVMWRYCNGEGI